VTVSTEPTIDHIQASIKRRLETIEGLRASATEPDSPNFPFAYPRLVDWTFDQEFGEPSTLYHFDIWVVVGLEPGFSRAQTWINPYLSGMGSKSIKCAIDGDPRLGGCVSFARVTGGGQYGETTVGVAAVRALAASVRLEVFV